LDDEGGDEKRDKRTASRGWSGDIHGRYHGTGGCARAMRHETTS
jgi:hypothetical protein